MYHKTTQSPELEKEKTKMTREEYYNLVEILPCGQYALILPRTFEETINQLIDELFFC